MADRALLDVSYELRERPLPETLPSEVVDLDQHGRRDDDWFARVGQELRARLMVGLAAVECRVQLDRCRRSAPRSRLELELARATRHVERRLRRRARADEPESTRGWALLLERALDPRAVGIR